VRKQLNLTICHLGCGLGWAEGSTSSTAFTRWCQYAHMGGHIGATWRILLNRQLRWRCGLLSHYFDHLLILWMCSKREPQATWCRYFLQSRCHSSQRTNIAVWWRELTPNYAPHSLVLTFLDPLTDSSEQRTLNSLYRGAFSCIGCLHTACAGARMACSPWQANTLKTPSM